MEILAAFIAGAIFARFVMSSKRSAIDHALEGTRGLPPRRPPPSPRRPFVDDPTLGPDQVLRLNIGRNSSGGGGWPT